MIARARPARKPTGRPLVALAVLIAFWITARALVWEIAEQVPTSPAGPAVSRAWRDRLAPPAANGATVRARTIGVVQSGPVHDGIASRSWVGPPVGARSRELGGSTAQVPSAKFVQPVPEAGRPVPRAIDSAKAAALPALGPAWLPAAPFQRWSADVWLSLRQGAGAPVASSGALPVYGASQAGAVVRYRLIPSSPIEPTVYARAVHALGRPETDLAAGFAVRPLPSLPVRGQIEARLAYRGGKSVVRPAAFLTAGIDRARMPMGLEARGFLQAGYVGGRDPTGFADGSLIAERPLWARRDTVLAAGAGAWGGAQRGAARLDIGPSASLRLPLSEGSARLSVDYRHRVAGNAEPASGTALTLSAGF